MTAPDVSRETSSLTSKIEGQIAARARGDRKNVFHGGTLCSHCLSAPRSGHDAYCAPCRAKYMRGWRKVQVEKRRAYEAELRALRALNGKGE
jgi:hypothetical protein